ncbi:MAG: SH3 domain-containing protein [Clostridia bacterium]|nr:SH3 domain-containing protein [Clostridia bacterium]
MKRKIAAVIAGVCLFNTLGTGFSASFCNAQAETAEKQTYWVNPEGGTRYHWIHHCASIHPRYYDGMIEITEDQLSMSPYDLLSPCSVCMGLSEDDSDTASAPSPATQDIPESGSIEETVIQNAKDLLTEVYGWSYEDSEKFIFHCDEANGLLEYWPDEGHSEYCYRLYFDQVTGRTMEAATPFYQGDYENYPGEGNIREIADAFDKNDWLHHWDSNSIQLFSDKLYRWGVIIPTQRLEEGLKSGNITASEAIRELWLSCLGPEEGWTHAASMWLKELLGEENINTTASEAREPEEKPSQNEDVRIELENNIVCTASYFVESIPDETNLEQYINQGWKLVEGVLAQFSREGDESFDDSDDQGLFILEKDSTRIAVSLIREHGRWEPHAIGPCVLSDREISVTMTPLMLLPRFRINYGEQNGETVSCICEIDADGMIHLNKYNITFGDAEKSFQLYDNGNDRWTWITSSSGEKSNGSQNMYISSAEAMLRFGELPKTSEDFVEWNQTPFPENYAMVSGVHLREKKSSHSRDLGLLNPGTIVQILGKADGDPFPWYEVRLGDLKGFVSSVYVCLDDNDQPTASSYTLLPMGEAVEETNLKSGTGLFDRTVTKVAAGTPMHILFEKDGWCYVSIPSGDLGCIMDAEGTYGYFKRNALRMGLTDYELVLNRNGN